MPEWLWITLIVYACLGLLAGGLVRSLQWDAGRRPKSWKWPLLTAVFWFPLFLWAVYSELSEGD